MFKQYKEDIQSFIDHDPATDNPLEIILLYPGLKAYWFYNHNMPFIARAISQRSAHKTGIEIHPGAKIGRRVVIDHGHGIVIGETAEVGDDVMIYQGVTLGGTGKETGKRHPTLGNNVMVGAGAKLLGNFTVGDNSKIAAGAVVLGDVPEHSTAVGIPAKVVRRRGERVENDCDLDQTHIPDPVAEALCAMRAEIASLRAEISALENKNDAEENGKK